MTDYSQELRDIAEQLSDAERKIGELEAAKRALSHRRETILALCTTHGITAKKEDIARRITELSERLEAKIKQVHHQLGEADGGNAS